MSPSRTPRQQSHSRPLQGGKGRKDQLVLVLTFQGRQLSPNFDLCPSTTYDGLFWFPVGEGLRVIWATGPLITGVPVFFFKMAVVLTSEDDSYFSSTLRRSHSQPKFGTKRSDLHSSASTSRLSDLIYSKPTGTFSGSPGSSAPSSPQATHAESADLSDSSTPATNFSLASDCDDASATPEEATLRLSADQGYFGRLGNQEPPPSLEADDSDSSSPGEQDDSAATSRPGSPDFQERAEDDIAVRTQPSRHVDYLSHNWREEDIWSSWKLIVSRRGDYNNSARLENASWRTWMKSKNNLDTVSAETLNW